MARVIYCIHITLVYFCISACQSSSFDQTQLDDFINDEDLFEGDMIGTPYFVPVVGENGTNDYSGFEELSFRWEYGRWPNGRIPYNINRSFTNDEIYKIKSAMKEFSKYTCIRFVRKSLEATFLDIRKIWNGRACHAEVGYADNGPRIVRLHNKCFAHEVILHELMHVLGFYHEHTRVDRDNYVFVNYSNIDAHNMKNFQKRTFHNETHLDTEYDFKSVMHYKSDAGAKANGLLTIVPRMPGIVIKADRLSEMDILRVNRLYQCHNYTSQHHNSLDQTTTRISQESISVTESKKMTTNFMTSITTTRHVTTDACSKICSEWRRCHFESIKSLTSGRRTNDGWNFDRQGVLSKVKAICNTFVSRAGWNVAGCGCTTIYD